MLLQSHSLPGYGVVRRFTPRSRKSDAAVSDADSRLVRSTQCDGARVDIFQSDDAKPQEAFMFRTAIAISLTLAAGPALAASEIYKCIDPAGKVEYRNSICPSGTKSAAVEFPVATGKVIEVRRAGDR